MLEYIQGMCARLYGMGTHSLQHLHRVLACIPAVEFTDRRHHLTAGTLQDSTSPVSFLTAGMGFDAIWISPISDQSTGPGWENPVGYHGEGFIT
jgi:glycosidase